MRTLPVVAPSPSKPARRDDHFGAAICHLLRCLVVLAFLLGLHQLVARRHAMTVDDQSLWNGWSVGDFIPNAVKIAEEPSDPGLRLALDATGKPLAKLAQTSPQGDKITGYAGPTRCLLLLDDNHKVTGVKVLRSFDTPEHLRKVQRADAFWRQFEGLTLGQRPIKTIDGVSGATLTSLAIGGAILRRVAHIDSGSSNRSEQPALQLDSVKFPKPLTLDELAAWRFPGRSLDELSESIPLREPDSHGAWTILVPTSEPHDGSMPQAKQSVFRTGPFSDSINGFQGPTELLFCIDEQQTLVDVRLRSSFDNQPYVRYTQQERSFWKRFKGRPLSELATLDRDAEQIDGVSGATMTSIAVVDTIRQASAKYLEVQAELKKQVAAPEVPSLAPEDPAPWNFSQGETFTLILALAAVVWSVKPIRGVRWARLAWQIGCLVILVGISGNLLSLSLFSGWTRGGVSLFLAPGLTALLVISLLMPALSKRNVYCDHLCPHGTMQQWLRPAAGRMSQFKKSPLRKFLDHPATTSALRVFAWAAVALAFIVIVYPLPVNLAWLEPFDGYLLRVGVGVSVGVAIVSLIASRISPMYYCRHACPTGKVLDYLRRDRTRGRLGAIDFALIAATIAAWSIR